MNKPKPIIEGKTKGNLKKFNGAGRQAPPPPMKTKELLKSTYAININIEEHIANGKLMAVAPELLEALKTCYASLCTYGSHPIIEKQVENVLRKLK